MKIGTGILLWSGGASLAAGLTAPMIFGSGTSAPLAAAVTAFAVLAIAPLVWLLNRDEDRLLDAANETTNAQPVILPVSALMRPISDAIRRLIDENQCDVQTMLARVRELEIRAKISDSERERLETVLHSLHDAVIVTNAYGELRLINPVAASLLGVRIPEDLNRSAEQVISDERITRLIVEAHESRSPSYRTRAEVDVSDASAGPDAPGRAHEATIACLPDQNEPVGGVVLILRDIAREREISQVKSEFVSKASHELRTPLSSINAYIEMLLDGEATDPEAQTEFYHVIKSEADRLGRLIDNMLNISRIEAGISKAKYEDMDFVKAAHAAVSVIEPQAKLKDITVRVKSGPLLYSAEADRDMIQQVLLNLLSNAVKYSPDGGRVTVTVENDETTGSVMTTVADTGLGIPPDSLPHVFDKFYRVENYKRVAKGTGLGLNLVKHIVETVHGGQVAVTSEVGMGSRFVFTIPYVRQSARRAA